MFMLRVLVAVSIAMLASVGLGRAGDTEKLLLKPPKGYKLTTETSAAKEAIATLLRDGDGGPSWTEKITAQTLFGSAEQSPEAYRDAAQKAAAASCPGVRFERLKPGGTENLYPMAMWSETCPQAKDSGKPEITWVKAVQGRDNFYVLRATMRAEPTAKQLKVWTKLFDATRVCDSRVPGQRCSLK
jgi:hypothetical protein